jgi:hypothetical protein
VVFPGDANGPDGWSLNPSARVTAVVSSGGKVKSAFGFGSVNETDVPPVREAFKKALAAQ